MKWGLVPRAIAAGVLLALLVGAAFAVLLNAIEEQRQSGREEIDTREELAALDNLEKTVIDLETGQRGFVITRKERFLQPWRAARDSVPEQSANLIALIENPVQEARTRRIIQSVREYIRDYSVPRIRAVRQGDRSVRSVAATQQGKDRVDTLRAQFDGAVAVERDQLDARQEEANDDADRAVVIGVIGLAGSVILILLLLVLVGLRNVVLPIRRTSAAAGRLAEDDLSVRLPAKGVGEIGDLERAFNQMGDSLQARNAELTASRARVVAAGDEMRRRIMRDLHDGAQQSLVRTVITLKLARQSLGEKEGDAAELLDEALEQADRANADLRELAHGVLPAVLSRGGLRAGVEALASRTPIPVSVDVFDHRLPPSLEATAYFITAEALTNVVKHAQANRAEVRASLDDAVLRLEVRDDGIGGAQTGGSGLVGLSDRAAAFGGTLEIESRPGSGTDVVATLPVPGQSGDGRSSAAE